MHARHETGRHPAAFVLMALVSVLIGCTLAAIHPAYAFAKKIHVVWEFSEFEAALSDQADNPKTILLKAPLAFGRDVTVKDGQDITIDGQGHELAMGAYGMRIEGKSHVKFASTGPSSGDLYRVERPRGITIKPSTVRPESFVVTDGSTLEVGGFAKIVSPGERVGTIFSVSDGSTLIQNATVDNVVADIVVGSMGNSTVSMGGSVLDSSATYLVKVVGSTVTMQDVRVERCGFSHGAIHMSKHGSFAARGLRIANSRVDSGDLVHLDIDKVSFAKGAESQNELSSNELKGEGAVLRLVAQDADTPSGTYDVSHLTVADNVAAHYGSVYATGNARTIRLSDARIEGNRGEAWSGPVMEGGVQFGPQVQVVAQKDEKAGILFKKGFGLLGLGFEGKGCQGTELPVALGPKALEHAPFDLAYVDKENADPSAVKDVIRLIDAAGAQIVPKKDNPYVLEVIKTIVPSVLAPQNLTARPLLDDGAALSWDSVDGAVSYNVYRMLKGGKPELIAVALEDEYIDSSAVAGQYNFYLVSANRKMDDGRTASGPASAYAYCLPYGLEPVDDLKAARHEGAKVHLTWDKVPGAEGYLVYREQGEGGFAYLKMTSNTGLLDADTKPFVKNRYRVHAYGTNKQGKRVYSAGVTVSCTPMLADVTQVKAALVNGQAVKLSWDQVKDATHYAIFAKADGVYRYKYVVPATSTSWVDKSPVKGEVNFYFVRPAVMQDGKLKISPTTRYAWAVVPAGKAA